MPEPDCFLRYPIGYFARYPIGYFAALPRLSATCTEFCVGKIPPIHIGGAPLERAVVLKWFYSLSRQKTFVGGKYALLSSLLVIIIIIIILCMIISDY